ncbi:MAG: LPS ABC transporter substrate-binding protein LptA, partial [Mesorhizobium sp.]
MRLSSSIQLLAAASALLGLGLFLGIGPSLAQSSTTSQLSGLKLSGDKPIQIESDKLEVRQADSIAVFTGNV